MKNKKVYFLLLLLLVAACCLFGCTKKEKPTPKDPVQLDTPVVTVDDDGIASWEAIPNAVRYVYKINLTNETSTSKLQIKLKDGQSIKVKAVGNRTDYLDSEYSAAVVYNAPVVPVSTIKLTDYVVSWDNYKKGTQYTLSVEGDFFNKQDGTVGKDTYEVTTTDTSIDLSDRLSPSSSYTCTLVYTDGNGETVTETKTISTEKASSITFALNDDGDGYVAAMGPKSGRIVIPDTYLGKPVTEIGDWAFGTKPPLLAPGQTLTLNNITAVRLPLGLKKIGESAFSLCALTEINLPDGVEYIGDSAFYCCFNTTITRLELPVGLKKIGNYAFLSVQCTELTIPETVESIGNYAFRSTSITSLSIDNNGDNLRYVGYMVFDSTPWLTEQEAAIGEGGQLFIGNVLYKQVGTLADETHLTLPANVKVIAGGAFEKQKELKSVTFLGNVKVIAEYLFRNSGLTSVTLPGTVEEIRDYAFYGNNLTEIDLPSGLTKIGSYAFNNNKLTALTIPASVKEIDSSCFPTSLTSLTILTKQLDSVGDYAFSGVKAAFTISAVITEIGKSAFSSCSGLTELTLLDGSASIGNYAFVNCTALTKVTLPDSVKELGEYAFKGCTALTTITLSDKLTGLGESTFEGCTALIEISLVNITKIGEKAFSNCTSLTTVTLSDKLTEIESYAFEGCAALTSKFDLKNVNLGDYRVFSGCESLTEVFLNDNLTKIPSGTFFGCKNLVVNFPSKLKEIGENAFYGCEKLVISGKLDNLDTLGKSAFYGCIGLTEFYCGEYLNAVKENAFYGCVNLKTVVIDGATGVEVNAFGNCTSLESVEIKKFSNGTSTLTGIRYSAFNGCSSLKYVVLPQGMTSFYESSFYNMPQGFIIYFLGNPTNTFKIYLSGAFTTLTWASAEDYLGVPVYFYSATEPSTSDNYWHYDTDNKPVAWIKQQ